MNTMVKNVFWNILLSILIATGVSANAEIKDLKCFKCFTKEECAAEQIPLMECNKKEVQETASHFQFLPNVMNQAPSNDFYCGSYTGVVNNFTMTSLKGCFYSTYNPCSFVSNVDHNNVDYKCKYCNMHHGCNASGRLVLLPIGLYVGLLKLIYLF